jgi:hypothetical protein
MKLTDMKSILESICPRVAYDHFNKDNPQMLPFIAYGERSRDDFYADNRAYVKIVSGFVELYTGFKDEAMEDKLELLLETSSIPYEKEYEVFIKDEDMFLNRWNISIMRGD